MYFFWVFPAACTNFRPLDFSLLAGWKGVTSFERSRKRRCLFCWPWPFDLAVFFADSWNRRYVDVDAKRNTSKGSRYNATRQYASHSLHARLRFSRCMLELSSARFQSASRVKMRDGVSFRERGKFHDVVRMFQKRRKKLHKTGSNRFIPVLYPDTSRKARHNRQY